MSRQPARGPSVAVAERAPLTARSGKRAKSEKRVLSKLVGVRMTDDEHARYAARAEQLGMTVPALMRACTDTLLDLNEVQEANR